MTPQGTADAAPPKARAASRGLFVGVLLSLVIGLAVGDSMHHPWMGAAIGFAAGAVLGFIIAGAYVRLQAS